MKTDEAEEVSLKQYRDMEQARRSMEEVYNQSDRTRRWTACLPSSSRSTAPIDQMSQTRSPLRGFVREPVSGLVDGDKKGLEIVA